MRHLTEQAEDMFIVIEITFFFLRSISASVPESGYKN